MKTYKYNVEVISQKLINDLPYLLNNMGKDGWKFVSLTQDANTRQWMIIYEKEE